MINVNKNNSLNVSSNVNSLGKRYRLLEEIGQGAMGVVYRTYDRISGETVALKRLLAELGRKPDLVFGTSSDLRLLLASEFQSLASLRHPNIISVYDYGFDNREQPYFTMELLREATSIVEYGSKKALVEKVHLLVQLLQALAYLHRRGIVQPDDVWRQPRATGKNFDFLLHARLVQGRDHFLPEQ